MSALRDICLALSFSLIGAGLICLISPGAKWDKMIKYVTGLFIVCCFAIPLAGADISETAADFDLKEYEFSVRSDGTRTMLDLTAKQIAENDRIFLAENGYSHTAVKVELTGDDAEIDGLSVIVFLNKEYIYQRDDIFSLLNDRYGTEAEIIIKEAPEDEG